MSFLVMTKIQILAEMPAIPAVDIMPFSSLLFESNTWKYWFPNCKAKK